MPVDVLWGEPDQPWQHWTPRLTDTERHRCATMPAARATAFAFGRVLLREVVAARTATSPEQAVHHHPPDRHGSLQPQAAHGSTRVSLTRSQGLVAVAVADVPVGLDLELPREPTPSEARLALGPDVAAALSTLSPPAAAGAFAERWTAIEAVLKLTGDGLRVPPSTLAFDPDTITLTHYPGRPELSGALALHRLHLPTWPRRAGCLAVLTRQALQVTIRRHD